MSIKIHYKEFNLIVHNTDTRFGFGGNIEDNPVFKVDRKGIFWDVTAYTLPELQVKFEKLVDEKLKITEDINRLEEDKEVQLVNQFISDLNQVLDEMEVVEKNVYYEVVLEAKLMKLMKAYGDSLCLGSSINVYRSHYNYVVKQREEAKKPKIYLSDNKGNVISLPCKIREDGYIVCEPWTHNPSTIVGFKLETH